MSLTLRIILLAVSALTFVWIIRSIRKSRAKIEDAVFWVLFAAFLILIALFPKLVTLGARLVGVQSEVNFVFLSIIFILLVKVFRMSLRISQLESKLQHFAQTYAIETCEKTACDLEEAVK